MAKQKDDMFELFDLRVEVVADGRTYLLLARRSATIFELRGEMLHLPPGRASRSTSLASVLPLLAAARADPQERLDDHRRRDRLPRPALRLAAQDHAAGLAEIQPRGNDSSASR